LHISNDTHWQVRRHTASSSRIVLVGTGYDDLLSVQVTAEVVEEFQQSYSQVPVFFVGLMASKRPCPVKCVSRDRFLHVLSVLGEKVPSA
jgi:hypothetical protein